MIATRVGGEPALDPDRRFGPGAAGVHLSRTGCRGAGTGRRGTPGCARRRARTDRPAAGHRRRPRPAPLVIRALAAGGTWLGAGRRRPPAVLLRPSGLPATCRQRRRRGRDGRRRARLPAGGQARGAAACTRPTSAVSGSGWPTRPTSGGPSPSWRRSAPGRPVVLLQPMQPAGHRGDRRRRPGRSIRSGGDGRRRRRTGGPDRGPGVPVGTADRRTTPRPMLGELRTAPLFDGYRGAPTRLPSRAGRPAGQGRRTGRRPAGGRRTRSQSGDLPRRRAGGRRREDPGRGRAAGRPMLRQLR